MYIQGYLSCILKMSMSLRLKRHIRCSHLQKHNNVLTTVQNYTHACKDTKKTHELLQLFSHLLPKVFSHKILLDMNILLGAKLPSEFTLKIFENLDCSSHVLHKHLSLFCVLMYSLAPK